MQDSNNIRVLLASLSLVALSFVVALSASAVNVNAEEETQEETPNAGVLLKPNAEYLRAKQSYRKSHPKGATYDLLQHGSGKTEHHEKIKADLLQLKQEKNVPQHQQQAVRSGEGRDPTVDDLVNKYLGQLPPTVNPDDIVVAHSLIPPFLSDLSYFSSNAHFHWRFGRSTVISDRLIRLTPSKQSRQGNIWNKLSCGLKSWTVHAGFRVHSRNAAGGDGLAVWYASRPSTSGGDLFGFDDGYDESSSGGRGTADLGENNRFRGLGVILDSFDNDGRRDNPRVSIVVGTGNPEDKLHPDKDFVDEEIGSCVFDFRNTMWKELVRLRIHYNGENEQLDVFVGSGDGDEIEASRHKMLQQHTPSHSHPASAKKKGREEFTFANEVLCASIPNIKLPTGYFFGLSARTGHLADNHDVYYFTVSANLKDRTVEAEAAAAAQQQQQQQHDEANPYN